MVVRTFLDHLQPDLEIHVEVRPYGLDKVTPMRDLNPEDIDKLVCIKGMIIRSSNIIPDLRVAYFECIECKYSEYKPIEQGRINEPTICSSCRSKFTMQLKHNRCTYADKQIIKLQETPESIPEGATPQTVQLTVHESLVEVSRPGDKVIITGIFRANPIRASRVERKVKQIYRTYIDVLHFKRADENQLDMFANDYKEAENISGDLVQEESKLVDLSKDENIYQILTNSLAPSIWELDDIKKGILCQLFGGSAKKFEETSTGKFRSEINVLLCGDPGTSKSQLLQYVHKIAPRGIYTSGKGSSAVGLTAYIAKDPDSGEAVLESGALVLSDRGICCIDEFDKMSDTTRSILHEAMEQQTVSVAKAGIICSLNARTSILASANPKESRYNASMSVVDNIQLPPTLLSRFDLIYLVLDRADKERDTKLAKHIVSLYFTDRAEAQGRSFNTRTIHTSFLTKYISYAKSTCNPILCDEAATALVEGYVDMRKGGEFKKTITATTRQLESLIRLSEALAKMRLSEFVLATDVHEAIRLMKVATYKTAMDPRTGLLDMDLINTGRGISHENKIKKLVDEVGGLIRTYPGGLIPMEVLWKTLVSTKNEPVTQDEFQEVLLILQENHIIAFNGGSRGSIHRL